MTDDGGNKAEMRFRLVKNPTGFFSSKIRSEFRMCPAELRSAWEGFVFGFAVAAVQRGAAKLVSLRRNVKRGTPAHPAIN